MDIDPATFCLDPDAAAAAVGPRTAAIMAVHLYGHPAAMDRLAAVAERHGLALVDDAAQTGGARFRGQPVGGSVTRAATGPSGCSAAGTPWAGRRYPKLVGSVWEVDTAFSPAGPAEFPGSS